jgi:hypothetical protein
MHAKQISIKGLLVSSYVCLSVPTQQLGYHLKDPPNVFISGIIHSYNLTKMKNNLHEDLRTSTMISRPLRTSTTIFRPLRTSTTISRPLRDERMRCKYLDTKWRQTDGILKWFVSAKMQS